MGSSAARYIVLKMFNRCHFDAASSTKGCHSMTPAIGPPGRLHNPRSAVLLRPPRSQYTGRNPRRHDAIGQRFRHHGAGADDRIAPHVGHHHGGAADPRSGADPHRRQVPACSRIGRDGSSMPCVRAPACHVDAGGQEGVALDVSQADVATGADVDVRADAGAGLGEQAPRNRSTAVGWHSASVHARNARRRYWPASPGSSDSISLDPSRARSGPISSRHSPCQSRKGPTATRAASRAAALSHSRGPKPFGGAAGAAGS